MKRVLNLILEPEFRLPLFVFILTVAGFLAGSELLYVIAIGIGLISLGSDSAKKIFERKFSLDYIAILAMAVALATRELIAGAIISLMILVSEALEAYGSDEAEAALRHLVEKIPKACEVKTVNGFIPKDIHEVRDGEVIFIRPGEIVPLDGYLISAAALMDEANLTGELEPQSYTPDQLVKSGLVNLERSIELRVSGDFSRSTYQQIVGLVGEARQHPARLVRDAERYNYLFTAITLAIAGGAYLLSRNPITLLAVLVLATPCPLLIAAPVSFLGGLNKASKRNVIIKRPGALEAMAKVTHIYFDKTGTLTLGEPILKEVQTLVPGRTSNDFLAIAAAIEQHSLHPLAKALTHAARKQELANLLAVDVKERIGDGISGVVAGTTYQLSKSSTDFHGGIVIDLSTDGEPVSRFIFEDQIKPGTAELLHDLKKDHTVAILTGDTEENAQALFGGLGVEIYAKLLPQDKYALVKATRLRGGRVLMVGDGLNDAPALALADVGLVFSGSENSASIDAAAVAILGRNIRLVGDTMAIATDAVRIARQSIFWGIGLSTIGMLVAAFGFIPPIAGAVIQEAIDATVILNALRAAR